VLIGPIFEPDFIILDTNQNTLKLDAADRTVRIEMTRIVWWTSTRPQARSSRGCRSPALGGNSPAYFPKLRLPEGVQHFGECARAESAGQWRRTALRDARVPAAPRNTTRRLGCDRVGCYSPD
jgi:hypothetical protein